MKKMKYGIAVTCLTVGMMLAITACGGKRRNQQRQQLRQQLLLKLRQRQRRKRLRNRN